MKGVFMSITMLKANEEKTEGKVVSDKPVLRERLLYRDEQPCKHKGCAHHVKNPCEGCGRIGARGEVWASNEGGYATCRP